MAHQMKDTDDLQQADEERAFFRCLELYRLAERRKPFVEQDLLDLKYYLGLTNSFKEKAQCPKQAR